jgi:hypothetical protein
MLVPMRTLLVLAFLAANTSCIVVTASHCTDGRTTASETDVDCGGVCGGCSDGRRCATGSDCLSGVCTGGICGAVAPQCQLPTQAAFNGNYPLFRVFPNASTAIPGGDYGIAVTTNGSRSYTVAWSDTNNSATCFGAIVRSAGSFSGAVQKRTGQETVTATASEVRFASVPGSDVDGITFTITQEPLYIDAYINGSLSGGRIFYTDGSSQTVMLASQNPAAFSP